MQLDSALLGVIVGSLLSLIGNFASHWFSMKKEEKHWQREQLAEENKRKLDDEKQQIEKVRTIYHNCISRLSIIKASKSEEINIPKEKIHLIHQEAFEWLSLLWLHLSNFPDKERNDFYSEFRSFTDDPDYQTGFMLQTVYKIAQSDKIIFSDTTPKIYNPNIRQVQLNIDRNFRKQEMIAGKPLKESYMLEIDIVKLKPSQREKLWEQNKLITNPMHLSLPIFNEQSKQIDLKGHGIWIASINPNEVTVEAIFDEWEKEYEQAVRLAEEKLHSFPH